MENMKGEYPDDSIHRLARRAELSKHIKISQLAASVMFLYPDHKDIVQKIPDITLFTFDPKEKFGNEVVVIEIALPGDSKALESLAYTYLRYSVYCKVFIGIDLQYPKSKKGSVFVLEIIHDEDAKKYYIKKTGTLVSVH